MEKKLKINEITDNAAAAAAQRGGGGQKKVTTVTIFSKITTAVLREGFLVFVEIGKSGDAVQGANMLSYVRGFYIIS